MRIRRDYSEPFFASRRARRGSFLRSALRGLLVVGVVALLVYTQFDTLRDTAYDMMGLNPTPTPLPGELAMRAAEFYVQGNLAAASDLFARVVAERPDNVDYLYEYGRILIELNRPEESLLLADRIINLDAFDPRGPTLKVRAMIWLGESSGAIPIGLAGLELNPGYGPLHAELARAYTNTQRWQDGLRYGERAIELAPYDPEAHRSYAHALSAVGAYDEAMRELILAIDLNPVYMPPYFELASLYLARDLDQEAIDLYDRILGMQPRNARAMLRLCQAYRKIGQFERALGFCEDAVENQPDFVEARAQLGLLYYSRLDFTRALDNFQACVQLDPANLGCTYRLGLAHYYLGDCEPAWNILQDSLLMAQARDDTAAIDNIRQGLSAITGDPACMGGGFPQPESTPESTEESSGGF